MKRMFVLLVAICMSGLSIGCGAAEDPSEGLGGKTVEEAADQQAADMEASMNAETGEPKAPETKAKSE